MTPIDDPLDQQITRWRALRATISHNILELSEAPSTQLIRMRLEDMTQGYIGLTQRMADEALKTLDQLMQDYAALARVLDEAFSLADKNGIFVKTTDQVQHLLNSASVTLPAEHIPIAMRGLLTHAEHAAQMTPDEMLAAMQQRFEYARDILNRINAASNDVQTCVADLPTQARQLAEWAQRLNVTLPALPALASIERDPLENVQTARQIQGLLAEQRIALQKIELDYEAMRGALLQAKADLGELQSVLAQSQAAADKTQVKIANPPPLQPPLAPAHVQVLQAWLGTLEAYFADGHLAAVRVGFAKWERDCAAHLTTQRAIYAANQKPLDDYDDLRGRFKALRAKCATLQQRGLLLEDVVQRLATQAQQALDMRPCDVTSARRLVAAFESVVLKR